MADLLIRGAKVLGPAGFEAGDLAIVDGVIVADDRPRGPVLDAAGLVAAPGFVDLQCNGGVGIDLAGEPERLWELAAALPRWGVTAWLPTIVTGPPTVTERALATLAGGPPPGWAGAIPLGLHLEGPFLAHGHRGAHRPEHLRRPELAAVDGWGRDAGVAMVTLAPELPGALEVIEALAARDVAVSLGHSGATAAQARAGIDAGATWVTHLWNAMAPLHHREPGLVGVALTDERVRAGVIADGIHLDPTVVALTAGALGDRLVLVTDAVSALGLPGGRHRLGTVEVELGEGRGVRLADGTLAGSDLAMDQAVRNLRAFSGCPVERALAAASGAPAAVLGDAGRGALEAGRQGDVVLLDDDLEVLVTVVAGAVVHDVRP
ncbi:MAG TPA: N-acetylglucosamine-6-phosphate deacetylase [Acidimicrobiales bacterium]|nr:N-acetylglucosamine-6-phosphate deacetylase [Acidimicrobiales bacterium]